MAHFRSNIWERRRHKTRIPGSTDSDVVGVPSCERPGPMASAPSDPPAKRVPAGPAGAALTGGVLSSWRWLGFSIDICPLTFKKYKVVSISSPQKHKL